MNPRQAAKIKRAGRDALTVKFREVQGLRLNTSLKDLMYKREVLRELEHTEEEIEKLFPLPRSGKTILKLVPKLDTVEISEPHSRPVISFIPDDEPRKNEFSTSTALYSVTVVIEKMIESLIYCVDRLADTSRKSVYFSEKVTPPPTLIQAHAFIEYKKNNPDPTKIGIVVNRVRTPAEILSYLLSDWSNTTCAIKTKMFQIGMEPYFENARTYQCCVSSIQNAHVNLGQYKVVSAYTPQSYFDEMLAELAMLSETTFDYVHFKDVERPNAELVIERIVSLGKSLKDSIRFVSDNLHIFLEEKRPWVNMRSPLHDYRIWEI